MPGPVGDVPLTPNPDPNPNPNPNPNQVCPDPSETYHSPCGYPSAAQPDTFVNEEWFGLFAIRETCAVTLTLTLTLTLTFTFTLTLTLTLT